MTDMVLLGDEAVALGAVHAGLTAAYAYPGTPSTEILEYLIRYAQKHPEVRAAWSTNEKTAYEAALGVSLAGCRAMTSMKHVGLNVAADPFMNSAVVYTSGGLVVVVADDPGMHSSQNEQDSRWYADFAHVPCFEPADQQEAYDMTREAFDLSERFRGPIVVRLVTRLAHSRAVVHLREPRPANPVSKPKDPASWILLPGNARKNWHERLLQQPRVNAWSGASPFNALKLTDKPCELGVITTGIARNYFAEQLPELKGPVSHLHIGAYPIPRDLVRGLVAHVRRVLVLEEGYPYVERLLRGLLPTPISVEGKATGQIPPDGELTPDLVRAALGLPPVKGLAFDEGPLPGRPPQLCVGCPHADSFDALKAALAQYATPIVTADIGCYTLGALPPYNAIESCVCMGASVGMAKGASDAGLRPAVAVIGDSTFLHSGVTALMDAAAHNTDMTLVILDNSTTGMTGGQPTILSSSQIHQTVLGVGVDPAHCHIIETHRRFTEQNTALIKQELDYHGLSVIIAMRECIETLKAKRSEKGGEKK
jgi:indolepyruvate ferredoxin oxidoreductase, alpha subunit